MKRLHTNKPSRFQQTIALFLALIVLAISGGTTLTHTDDLGFARAHVGTSTVSHTVAATADTCPACQWENSLFSTQVPAVPLPLPVLTPLPVLSARFQARYSDPFDHTSPRAPPHIS